MKELVELIEKLLILFKVEPKIAHVISIVTVASGIAGIIFKTFLSIIKHYRLKKIRKELADNLVPYFTYQEIEKATKYFISTRYQKESPAEDDEPGINEPKRNKNLIRHFTKKLILNKKSNRFYVILADTGMGKTTFLINLYSRIKKKLDKYTPGTYLDIRLLPMGDQNFLSEIKKIQNPQNTILLLDALDEDFTAIANNKLRLNEIGLAANPFFKTIITCRTHFFSNESEEILEFHNLSFGGNEKEAPEKFYISVFTNGDVNKYLRKRYSILWFNYYLAHKIVRKSPTLSVRPMLLSYIGDLISSKRNYEYSFQIYEELIHQWIIRESIKPSVIKRYGHGTHFADTLKRFIDIFAWDLYINREIRGGFFIDGNERIRNASFHQDDFGTDFLKLTDNDKKTRSLLNRNSIGKYKFAHKSILEYLLAKVIFNDIKLLMQFQFDGMNASLKFYTEMLHERLDKLGCEYLHTDDQTNRQLKGKYINLAGKITIPICNFNLVRLFPFTNLTCIEYCLSPQMSRRFELLFNNTHLLFEGDPAQLFDFIGFLKKNSFFELAIYFLTHGKSKEHLLNDERNNNDLIMQKQFIRQDIRSNSHSFLSLLKQLNKRLEQTKQLSERLGHEVTLKIVSKKIPSKQYSFINEYDHLFMEYTE